MADQDEPIAEIRTCVDCGADFNIAVGEKEWFEKNQMTLPKRCKSCRKAKKDRQRSGGGGGGGRSDEGGRGGHDQSHGRGRRGRRDEYDS